MFRYIKIVAVILVAAMIFAGCSSDRFIKRQAKAYINSGGLDEDAHAWLLENDLLVGTYLAKNLSSANRSTAANAKALLKLLGEDGVRMVGSNYDLLASLGKENLAQAIAQNNTNTAVLQLLALSTLDGGLEPSYNALLTMDTIVIKTIAPLINQDVYSECVNYVLANYGNYAETDILPLVFDEDMSDRALEILSLSEEDISYTLIMAAFNKSNLEDELIADIANRVLINNKESAVDSIINTVAKGEGNEEYGAIMLYQLANDESCSEIFNKCATSINANNTERLLKNYIKLLGISIPLEIVLENPTDEIVAALAIGLDDPGYANDCFVEIVKAVESSDDSDSQLYKLAGQLISDVPLSQLAQSIIGTDTEMLNIALKTTQSISDMGLDISKTSDNTVVYDRLSTILGESQGIDKKNLLTILAMGSNVEFPSLVWETYKNGNEEDSQYAMDALLSSTYMDINFPYDDLDYMAYADRIVMDLKSEDEFTRSAANQLIDKIPEDSLYNDFYEYLFSQSPTENVFQALCMHYYGADALPIQLKISGSSVVINEIDIDIDEVEVDDVTEDQYIDYDDITSKIISSAGVEVVREADFTLNIDIEQDPAAKRYPGMVSKSYLGIKSYVDITVYVAGNRQSKYSGSYEISLPDEINVPDTTIEYMQRPIDAPMTESYEVSLIDALYDVFGIDILYGTYFYDREATMIVAEKMWGGTEYSEQ